jgi:hypothetical protein
VSALILHRSPAGSRLALSPHGSGDRVAVLGTAASSSSRCGAELDPLPRFALFAGAKCHGGGISDAYPPCSITPMPTASPPLVALPTCTCSPTPYSSPVVLIPDTYQPRDPYTAKLGWVVFTPRPAPSASPPGIIVIHGGNWDLGNALQDQEACRDLAAAGYYVVSVDYELARCGFIQGQNCHD